ncbi:MAG TPA: hypothetical protein VFK02_05640 [Kofleriaceae bacterium]|nr:hypothetical protein [Kofleriaceae bacterium]
MSRILVPLGFLTLLAAGCGSDPTVGTIELAVVGGLTGNGDGTALHIEPDGTAMRSVNGAAWQTATLDPATLRSLQAKINAADFPSLEPMYAGDVTDDFADQVTVELDGHDHTVLVEESADPPARLAAVIEALRTIHGSAIDWH